MKVKKFRIKNYKSIVDSGDCYLTDTITILAGKNESGKTAILEALEDFGVGVDIREEAKPVQSTGKDPEISITFIIEPEFVQKVLNGIKSLESLQIANEFEFEIVKRFPNQYFIGANTLKGDVFDIPEIKRIQAPLNKIRDSIKNFIDNVNPSDLSGLGFFELNFSDLGSTFEQLFKYIKDVKNKPPSTNTASILGPLSELEKYLMFLFILNLNYQTDFFNYVRGHIPHFSRISSLDDIFPDKIALNELENDEWIKDLSVKYGLDIKKIRNSVDRIKGQHKADVSKKLSKDYGDSWTQNTLNLSIDLSPKDLAFWVEENGHLYEPSFRSLGRQWHLAFHTRIAARARFEGEIPNVILIDEPGLFLHATAQRDILKTMETAAETVQVVFSTHSPYLIEDDKLNRVRLILKDEKEGTTICNKVHARADKETLTPIMTAIGFELNSGIAGFEKKNNVVVEGASDVYYLNAFKKLLGKEEISFIFGGGSGKMPNIGTILRGWGARVIYLCDNDDGGKNGAKNLKHKWHVEDEDILYVSDSNGSIEDIFSKDDFIKVVLKDHEGVSYSGSNSKCVKDNGLDKVLIAKQFLENCEGEDGLPKLDKESMGRVEQLFEKIEDRFKG